MKARRGQIAILLAAALLAVVVLAVMNVSVFLAVRAKNRAMNSGDAAALAVARHQGDLLNRIGRLNIEHLKALLDGDLEKCDAIMREQRRLCFLGPLEGLNIGSVAASANGASRDSAEGMRRILLDHVNEVRLVFANDSELYPPPWDGAWGEYADILESYVGTLGPDFIAGPDNVEFADAWECFPLLKKQFYNAIASRSWCWFRFNGEWLLDRDSRTMPRPDFSVRRSCDNCEVYPLHLEFRPIGEMDPEWRRILARLADREPDDMARFESAISSPAQEWAFFDGMWRTWWEIDPFGENRFPVSGSVKDEYNVRGCAALCRVMSDYGNLVDGGSGRASWVGAAKPFGTVENMNGEIAAVTALKGFVTPAFTDVRLMPVDSVGGADLATADVDWCDHVRKHLPVYYRHGPFSAPSDCWWCDQLRAWESAMFRAGGRSWLKHNSHSCVRPLQGGYSGVGGTPHGH